MKRIIFFLHHRSGSTLFQSLCGHAWRIQQAQGNYEEAKKYRWDKVETQYLPTIPPNQCPVGDLNHWKNKVGLDQPLYAWELHVGHWWGECRSDKVPDPYGGPATPSRWGPDELAKLPEGDWHFISLMRDGRNQIESQRRMRGPTESRRHAEDPQDYFQFLCKAWRNRARMALDCSKANNYTIFRFENLVVAPVHTMEEIFEQVGFELDSDAVLETLSVIKHGSPLGHSSFKDPSKMHERWHSWGDWEIDTFKAIAGKELEELGYTDWSK